MTLEAIRFDKVTGQLSILNQLLLPEELLYESVSTIEEGWRAIKQMKVAEADLIEYTCNI